MALGQQGRPEGHWGGLEQAVLALWAHCRVCVCVKWAELCLWWCSAVFWSTQCQGFHHRPWLTGLRYKGVCYTPV